MGFILSIILWIIAGAIIGFVARAIVPGKQNLSLPMTAGLGIVGMLVGGIVGRVITPDNQGVPWIAGTLCAIVILFALIRTGNLSRIASSDS